jgi:hypothetical protein
VSGLVVEEAVQGSGTGRAAAGRKAATAVGGGVEELGEAPAAEETAAWRSRPRWAAIGPGPLVEAGGCRRAGG